MTNMDNEERYWPFDILPRHELTDLGKKKLDFLERGYQAGYKPYEVRSSFGATGPQGRTAFICHRGGDRQWEVKLGEGGDESVASRWSTDFAVCTTWASLWLEGKPLAEVWNDGVG